MFIFFKDKNHFYKYKINDYVCSTNSFIMKIFLLFASVILLFFASCIIAKDDIYLQQKRQNRKLSKLEFVERQNKEVISIENYNTSLPKISYCTNKNTADIQPVFLTSINKGYLPLENSMQIIPFTNRKKPFNTVPVLNNSDTCDIIFKRDGEKIQAKVTEVGEDLIKYKICDFLTGPTYSISTENITMIMYSNGRTDVFKQAPKADTKKAEKRTVGVAGMIGVILCFPITALIFLKSPIVGLMFSIFTSIGIMSGSSRNLRYMSENTDKYKGQGFLIATIVLGAILLVSGIASGILLL